MLTVGSCFSGIGGIELGLERTGGFKTIWQIENDPYATAVLAKHWPDVKRYADITEIDESTLEPVDVICGGYPCQPFSLAGKRKGSEDKRHLWPYMYGIIRAVRPRYAILENVPGHLSLGFGRVLGNLAALGYDAEWGMLSAAGVGAPHLRRRVFIVAHAISIGSGPWGSERTRQQGRFASIRSSGEVADALRSGPSSEWNETGEQDRPRERCKNVFDAKKKQEGADTIPGGAWWSIEPDVGRVAHGVPSRVDRLKCLGNAVVPQVAEKVGRLILDYDA